MTMLYFGYVVGGAIGVEFVFSYPGLGTLTANAIEAQDYPMQQGLLLMFAAIVLAATLFTDVLYGYLDPRIREA
jgi:peptide/nickel transport system permease protein